MGVVSVEGRALVHLDKAFDRDPILALPKPLAEHYQDYRSLVHAVVGRFARYLPMHTYDRFNKMEAIQLKTEGLATGTIQYRYSPNSAVGSRYIVTRAQDYEVPISIAMVAIPNDTVTPADVLGAAIAADTALAMSAEVEHLGSNPWGKPLAS
jgi:hypothetical protein